VGYEPEPVSLEEILTYVRGESYEEDAITADEILGSELLLLHELVEISELKRMGFRIGPRTAVEAYPRTYETHLSAVEVELEAALRLGKMGWVERRVRDLESYLEDEHLPPHLRGRVFSLAERFRRVLSGGARAGRRRRPSPGP